MIAGGTKVQASQRSRESRVGRESVIAGTAREAPDAGVTCTGAAWAEIAVDAIGIAATARAAAIPHTDTRRL